VQNCNDVKACERKSERYIVMNGCMLLNKCPTTMCLAKKKKPKKVRKVHFWQSAKNIKLTYDPFLALKRKFSIAADSQWG